jgi:hypothetical protein
VIGVVPGRPNGSSSLAAPRVRQRPRNGVNLSLVDDIDTISDARSSRVSRLRRAIASARRTACADHQVCDAGLYACTQRSFVGVGCKRPQVWRSARSQPRQRRPRSLIFGCFRARLRSLWRRWLQARLWVLVSHLESTGRAHLPRSLKPSSDALYRIKRGLAGYVSYLAACEMNESFSEYVLYEPTLRILTARGFSVKCEFPCLGLKQKSCTVLE